LVYASGVIKIFPRADEITNNNSETSPWHPLDIYNIFVEQIAFTEFFELFTIKIHFKDKCLWNLSNLKCFGTNREKQYNVFLIYLSYTSAFNFFKCRLSYSIDYASMVIGTL